MPSAVFVSVPSYIFFSGMVYRAISREFLADLPIDAAFVGSEMGFPRCNGND